MVPVSLPTLALLSIPGFTPYHQQTWKMCKFSQLKQKFPKIEVNPQKQLWSFFGTKMLCCTQVGSLSICHLSITWMFQVYSGRYDIFAVIFQKISQCLHLFWDKLNIHITGMLHRVSDKLTHRINYSRTAIETNPVGKWNKCNLQLVPEDIGVGIVGDICIGTRGQGLLAMIICVTNCNFTIIPCSSSSASTLYPHKTN